MGGFVCPLCCDEIFANQLLLSYHLLSIADNLFCTECNQRFDDIRQFAQHLDGMCGKEKNEDIMSTDELNKIVNEKYGDDPKGKKIGEMENQMEINSRDVSHITDSMVTENAGSDQEILENVAIQDIVVNYGIEIVNGNNEIMEQQDVSSNDHQYFRDVTQMEVEDSVEMAHDTSELQVAEDQGKDTGSSVTDPYACSVCEMTFSSVMEHIKEYHQGQEVVVQVPESEKEILEEMVQESITVMEDETQMSKNCDLQEEFGDSSKELCSAVSKMNSKPLGCLKQQNRVVAEKHKQISHPKPVQNMSGLKCVSKEVKIDKFWENQPVEKHGGKIIGKPGKGGMFEVLKKEVRRFPLKKDPRSSIEKLFSGNCVLKNSGPDSKPKTYYIGGNGVPELKVFMSPDQEGFQTTISVYVCSSCRREFGSVSTFEKHDCRKAKASPMACKFCNAVFADLKSMKLHTKAVHNTKSEMRTYSSKLLPQPVKCGSCENTFMTMRALKLHEKIHLAPAELLECPVCRNKCSSNRTLKQHMTVHSDAMPKKKDVCLNINSEQTSNIDLLVCKLCYKSFESNEELKTHWQEHVNMDEAQDSLKINESDENKFTTIQCEHCHKEIDKSCKEEHMAKHCSLMRYDCPICNKSFNKQGHLGLHLKVHTDEKEYSCSQCKMIFADMNLLRNHIQVHMMKRPYQCGFCGRGFFRPHDKVEHERIHTGEKPYVCPVCGMKFRVRYCLTLHYRRHTGIRPYHCKHCDKSFRTGTVFKQHTKIHLDERAYKCPFCPKKFNTLVQLSGHKKSHTKPYLCDECNRPFSSLFAVKKHMTSHDEANSGKDRLRFQCHICGASYARRFALRDHLKGHDISSEPTEKECCDDSSNDLT